MCNSVYPPIKLAFFLATTFTSLSATIPNLAQDPSCCILETKQIHIEGYPDAFNPSIARWQNKLLLAFRARNPITQSTDWMGLIWLDDDFNAISKPQLIERRFTPVHSESLAQDPRLITIDDHLYIIYNNVGYTENKHIRRMLVAELHQEDDQFYLDTPQPLLEYPEKKPNRHEKNWSPFAYQHHLHLIYSISPHHILQPIPNTAQCHTVALNDKKMPWDWGELRGGTPALLEGDEYLTFFHSSIEMTSQQSKGKKMPHYFMGAYTFSAHPPFTIQKMSSEPIVGEDFYSGPEYKTWKPLLVVFPGGFISDGDILWVVYGKQDFEVWVVKIDKIALLNSLKPVSCGHSYDF